MTKPAFSWDAIDAQYSAVGDRIPPGARNVAMLCAAWKLRPTRAKEIALDHVRTGEWARGRRLEQGKWVTYYWPA